MNELPGWVIPVILVALVVIIVLIIIGVVAAKKKRERQHEEDRRRAAEMRAKAEQEHGQVKDHELKARERSLQAEQAQLAADRALRDAEKEKQAADQEQARAQRARTQYDEDLRRAEEIDPDSDVEAPKGRRAAPQEGHARGTVGGNPGQALRSEDDRAAEARTAQHAERRVHDEPGGHSVSQHERLPRDDAARDEARPAESLNVASADAAHTEDRGGRASFGSEAPHDAEPSSLGDGPSHRAPITADADDAAVGQGRDSSAPGYAPLAAERSSGVSDQTVGHDPSVVRDQDQQVPQDPQVSAADDGEQRDDEERHPGLNRPDRRDPEGS